MEIYYRYLKPYKWTMINSAWDFAINYLLKSFNNQIWVGYNSI
jgi:hypothetical protein